MSLKCELSMKGNSFTIIKKGRAMRLRESQKWRKHAIIFATTALAAILVVTLLFYPSVMSSEIPLKELAVYCVSGKGLLLRWIVALLIGAMFTLLFSRQSSGEITVKKSVAGDGQFGAARWSTRKERSTVYTTVHPSRAVKPGIIISYSKKHYEIDSSDHNMLLLAPPGARKTKGEFISTIKYNADVNRNTGGKGASMIIIDVKGEELTETTRTLEEAGYTVLALNFRFPMQSYANNQMNSINKYIDKAKNAQDERERITYYAKAERHAKTLANAIIKTSGVHTSESSEFFNATSEGLIVALILIVSEYGKPEERHIVSVFNLIVELNGLVQDEDGESSDTTQRNRLKELLDIIPESGRARMFAGASISADVRTSMNIFSSALSKLLSFINAELEQMICSHSPGFSAEELVEKPTAIFLIIPDEDTTRHFFSSLFIRQTLTELITLADSRDDLRLPRQVLVLWDEFGNAPPVKNADSLFTAARSCNIRLIIALQSLAQLENRYSRNAAQIIREACQMTMFSYTTPTAFDTAKELSGALGKYTTVTGSVSSGEKRSTSKQLVGRALMTEDEIMSMKKGRFIVMKADQRPIKTNLPVFMDIWALPRGSVSVPQRPITPVKLLTEKKLHDMFELREPVRQIQRGMFDEVAGGTPVDTPKKKRMGRKNKAVEV